MGKEHGYSIRVNRGVRTGVCVSAAGPGAWRLENLTTGAAEAPLPAEFRRCVQSQTGKAVWVAPDETVRSMLLSLPPLKGKELARAVQGWLSRQEEKPAEDLAVSWKALARSKGAKEEPHQDVYTLVMTMEDQERELAHAESLQVKPAVMLPGFVLLDQLFRRYGPDAGALKGWALVHLGEDENFLSISSPETTLLTRALPQDHSEGLEIDQFLNRLATEIDRSRFFVRQGAKSPEVERVIVCGDPRQAGPLAALLNEKGEIAAAHWAIEEMFSGEGGVPDAAFVMPLAGAALALEKLEFNLLPEAPRTLLGPVGRRRALVGGAALGAALVPLLVVGSVVTAKIQENYLKDAERRLEEARLAAQDASEVYKAHRLLTAKEACLDWLDRDRVDLENLMVDLADVTPEAVVYRELRVWEGQDGLVRLHLEGDSNGRSAGSAQAGYLDFQAALAGVDFLEGLHEPRLLEIKTVANKGRETPKTLFSLDLEIAPARGEER